MAEINVPQKFDIKTADAVVIGGGIVGTSTAFWLSKAGMKVILVDLRYCVLELRISLQFCPDR